MYWVVYLDLETKKIRVLNVLLFASSSGYLEGRNTMIDHSLYIEHYF